MSQPVMQERPDTSKARDVGLAIVPTVIAPLVVGLLSICAIFWREIVSAIDVWDASTAYSHCYLVLPMSLYLLWERRNVLATVRAVPDLRFVVAAFPLTLCWLVAERLGIMEARQLLVIAGVQLLCLAVLGARLYKALSGPLLFLFFLVPFGAFLTPALQQFTATFSIVGLDLLGIPNFSDKFTIETPAGIFFVAEACAGLRFLIAAIAFGVFYSLLSYTSLWRRIGFIAASIVVPIIANGFRALGIVVLGQVLGSAEAAAADHIVYGWVFFSVVMLLLILGGQAFRETDAPSTGATLPVSASAPKHSPAWAVAAVVILLAIGPASAGAIDSVASLSVMPKIATIVAPPGCSLGEQAEGVAPGQRTMTVVCDGSRFDVSVRIFPGRSTASAMIADRRQVTQEIGAENVAVSSIETAADTGVWTLVQTTDPNRVTASASWVDGAPVRSALAGRVAQARNSILGGAYAPALITITEAEPMNSPPNRRKATLDSLTQLVRDQAGLNARMSELTRLAK